jgi:hypothetical protein
MDMDEFYHKHGSIRDRLGDVISSGDVFDRQFGSELVNWERDLYSNFQERIGGRVFQYRGFVHYTRNMSLISLTPSPWLLEGQFVYFPEDQELPPEGALVEISGRSIAIPHILMKSGERVRAIIAESIELQPVNFLSDIEPPLSLRELSSMLFEHVGMAEASKRVFTQLFISSPPFQESVGGLSTGIQAIASKTQVSRLFRFLRQVLSPSLRGRLPKYKRIQGIQVSVPKTWRLESGQLGKSKIEKICVHRVDPGGFREVSMGIMTDSSTAAMPDVPLALATDDFWIENQNHRLLQLPIAKSVITYQMMTPQISERTVTAGTKHVLSRLDALKESFGLDDGSLSRGHVLDADALGRPLSTIRLARANARATWKDKIVVKDLKRAWDRLLEPALKEFIELAILKRSLEQQWGKGSPLHKFNTKVLRALKKLDTGKRGSLGPTLDEIAEESGLERHLAAEALAQMKDDGVLYEPRPGHFRLV